MLNRLFLATVVFFAWATPLHAQTAQTSSVEIEATVGLDGWIDHSRPVPVEVTIRSEVFFSGTLQLQSGTSIVTVRAEVPAGGEKTYPLLVSPTITDALLTLRLVPAGQEEAISSLRVQPRRAVDSVLIGTLGIEGLDLPTRTVVGDVPIVEVPIEELTAGIGALDYLVIGSGVVVTDELLDWVAEGGRLVMSSDAVTRVDLGAGKVVDDIKGVRFDLGSGEVVAVDDLTSQDAAWPRSLQPVRSMASVSDPWSSAEVQMLRAASSSVPGALTSPTILIGLAVYAAVVAPVNLIVLRRMQRRELAWITVPALGVVTVLIFAIVAVVRPQSSQFAHAALMIGTPERAEMRSVVVAATTAGRSHHLSVDPSLRLYPAAAGDALGVGLSAADRSVTSATELTLEFREAGHGTAGVIGPAPALPRISLATADGIPVLSVENSSGFSLMAYGIVNGPFVSVAPGGLAVGATGSVEVNHDNFGMASDVVSQVHQNQNSSRWWQVYGSLTSAAQNQVGEQYFFAFIDSLSLPIEIDGRPQEISGPGMIVIPLTGTELNDGRASPQIVAASPDSLVSGEGPWRWMEGEWAILRFEVPIARDIEVENNENMFGGGVIAMEGWDWEAASFALLDGEEVDEGRFVDGDGQMLVRVLPQDNNEFNMMQFSIASLSITWDSSSP